MKKISNIIIALASLFAMVSCSNDFAAVDEIASENLFSFQASMPQDVKVAVGDEAGYFSINNNNISFSAKESGSNVIFSGKLENNNEGEFSYVAYPYIKGASVDQNRNYTFSIPSEQIHETYNSSLSRYTYMIGYSNTTKSASSYQFENLMAKMNIVVANNTGRELVIRKVTMSTENGDQVFSTSATVNMNPTRVDMEEYSVSAPSQSSLSVRISNPETVQPERSQIISLMFFPASLEAATGLVFTVETAEGTYTTTKTIGGLYTLNLKRGETYTTPISVN